jgi:hypothetical protein
MSLHCYVKRFRLEAVDAELKIAVRARVPGFRASLSVQVSAGAPIRGTYVAFLRRPEFSDTEKFRSLGVSAPALECRRSPSTGGSLKHQFISQIHSGA